VGAETDPEVGTDGATESITDGTTQPDVEAATQADDEQYALDGIEERLPDESADQPASDPTTDSADAEQ